MDAVSYAHSAKQAQRIERFIEDPDSTSGVLTQPSVIQTGEVVTVPLGRTAILAGTQIDGDLVIDGDVFIPTGTSIDFSNGIKIDGNNIALSIPTAYHLLQGNLSVSNEVITNGFSTTLYTGNGGMQSISTGIDMTTQWGNDVSETFGGLVWQKSRSAAASHRLCDTVRGATNAIYSDLTNAQAVEATALSSFNSNGFTGGGAIIAPNGTTCASWNFQTTHRRTGVTNHGKAFTEHYNPFTGFTIIKYEGSGLAGHEIPHSLGRKLGFVTTKNLSAVVNWIAMIDDKGFLNTNTTGQFSTLDSIYIEDTKTILTYNATAGSNWNQATNQYIMYGWANSYLDETNKLIGNYEVGVYQGTGVAGNKVTTRGKPAWIMIKRLDATGNWFISDNQRNSGDKLLAANGNNVEWTDGGYFVYMIDGFKINSLAPEINASGGQYLYMVVYDNDSGSGKSKYPKATDTSNVQINNAIIPLAHGVDSNGSKNSIVIANETITGLTYTAGKNYLYKTDTGYGVKPYENRMLSSELVRRFAGEQPDYYDVDKNKWFNTDAGSELVSNGTFSSGVTTWWTPIASTSIAHINNTLRVNTTNTQNVSSVSTQLNLIVGKRYKIFGIITSNLGIGTKIDILDGSANTIFTSGYSTSSDKKEYDFIATSVNCTLNINIDTRASISTYGYIDNISIFDSVITPTTEITESRNYLNHIVNADQNGQVIFVEELPKIEYKDVIKANEFKGKNACTAWANIDMTTTPPTIRDSYNIGSVIRTSAGNGDIYFKELMDNTNYAIFSSNGLNAAFNPSSNNMYGKTLNMFKIAHWENGTTTYNVPELYIYIIGGKI